MKRENFFFQNVPLKMQNLSKTKTKITNKKRKTKNSKNEKNN